MTQTSLKNIKFADTLDVMGPVDGNTVLVLSGGELGRLKVFIPLQEKELEILTKGLQNVAVS